MEGADPAASRAELEDLLTRFFLGIDEGRWPFVEDLLAEKVLIDLSSSGVGKPTRTTRKKVVDALQSAIRGLTSVHHQLGNVLTDLDEEGASAFCYCTESDYFPNPAGENTYTIYGSYEFHLTRSAEGWRFDALRFNQKFARGNPILREMAKKAAKRG